MSGKREEFLKQINSLPCMDEKQYNRTIQELKEASVKKTVKTSREYFLLKRWCIISIKDVEKLIEKKLTAAGSVKYAVYKEEIFDILDEIHIGTGHGGRNRMVTETANKFSGITREIIMVFLSLCEECQLKRNQPKKGLVVKPNLSNEMNSRCQIDLIDFQSQPDNEFKFIFVYEDHLTKFVQLRSLKTNTALEVSEKLFEIFMTFGAPHILRSDNGREFANQVIQLLLLRWPSCKMVHGNPRHSQSQGSVEHGNQDVRSMLISWMHTNSSTNWSKGLWEVQFSKNCGLHIGINRSPYEAMFRIKPRLGLASSNLPNDVINTLETEEDMQKAIENVNEIVVDSPNLSCCREESNKIVDESDEIIEQCNQIIKVKNEIIEESNENIEERDEISEMEDITTFQVANI